MNIVAEDLYDQFTKFHDEFEYLRWSAPPDADVKELFHDIVGQEDVQLMLLHDKIHEALDKTSAVVQLKTGIQ